MVFPREGSRAVEVMTAAASSSSPSPPPHRPILLRAKPRSRLPFPTLKPWPNPHLLRCADDAAAIGAPAPLPTSSPSRPRSPGPGDDRYEEVRAKLLDHLREAAGRIELPPAASASAPAAGGETRRKGYPMAEEPDDGGIDSHVTAAAHAITVSVAAATPPAAEELPWNLRTRRSATASNGRHHHHPEPPLPPPAPPKPASRLRSGVPERSAAALRRRRPRFSLPLTKEEIDEDVYAFTGRLAARRPKKRPRAVQRQLDMLFPGLYLSEVTADMYQVADPPPPPLS